jgi:hypothetical protein
MENKRRKKIGKATVPPEIWTNVFGFLNTTQSFYSLYFLCKDLHNYPWKRVLEQLEFKMKRGIGLWGNYDFSYVYSLNLSDSGHVTDNELKQLKGIHSLSLNGCEQFTDAGLEEIKGTHTLSLADCRQITDHGLSHLKGIHTLDLFGLSNH